VSSPLHVSLEAALRDGKPLDAAGGSIDAQFLADLLGGRGNVARVDFHPRGLKLSNARICKLVDWSGDQWTSFAFQDCEFEDGVIARGLEVDGDASFHNCKASFLDLSRARISGDLDLEKASLGPASPAQPAVLLLSHLQVGGSISLRSAQLGGDVELRSFTTRGSLDLTESSFDGRLNLEAAQIGGDCEASEVTIRTPNKEAIVGHRVRVGGGLNLESANIQGSVTMVGAKIDGQLNLSGAYLRDAPSDAGVLVLYQASITRGVYMRPRRKGEGKEPFRAEGRVSFAATTVATVIAPEAVLSHEGGIALSFDGMNCDGNVNLSEIKASGQLVLKGASVRGDLRLNNAVLEHDSDCALDAAGLEIGGDITLEYVKALGKVSFAGVKADGDARFSHINVKGLLSLRGSTVRGDLLIEEGALFIEKGKLPQPDSHALDATGLEVGGDISLKGIESVGDVVLAGIKVDGDAWLNGLKVQGLLDIGRASLRGDLLFTGAELLHPKRRALDAAGLEVGGEANLEHTQVFGDASLTGVKVDGDTSFVDAKFDGLLDIGGANLRGDLLFNKVKFINRDGPLALDAAGLEVGGALIFEGAVAQGELSLVGVKVDGQLNFDGATLSVTSAECRALNLFQAEVRGGIFMRPAEIQARKEVFSATGEVSLNAARISIIDAEMAKFTSVDSLALTAIGLFCEGSASVREAIVIGRLDFSDATIDSFDLSGVRIEPQSAEGDKWNRDSQTALLAPRLECHAKLDLDGSRIKGRVNLHQAVVDGDVSLHDFEITFTPKESSPQQTNLGGFAGEISKRPVLVLELAHIKGNLVLEGGKLDGDCVFHDAQISGSLVLKDLELATQDSESRSAIYADQVDVGGRLTMHGLRWENVDQNDDKEKIMRFSLRLASVGELDDDPKAWPSTLGSVDLTGFRYNQFTDSSERKRRRRKSNAYPQDQTPWTVEKRLEWISIQTNQTSSDPAPGEYSPQPYFQLAEVYGRVGRDHEKRKVLMRQQDDLRHFGEMGSASKAWNKLVGIITGHGYALWRAGFAILAVYLLSVVLVVGVKSHNGFVAVGGTAVVGTRPVTSVTASLCTSTYPCVNTFVYPIDASIPIINFHQSDYWLFDQNKPWGLAGQYLFVLLTMAGWGFSSLIVAAASGLIRKD